MANPTTECRGEILVVDDTPANLTLLATVLKAKGYRVRAVPSGPLALEAAEFEVPELVLLDIMMPKMDGFEVCRRLKESERFRDVPVIFLSALSETLDKVRAFASGGVDYVTKPFQIEELEARVGTHVALRRLQLQLQERNRELQESQARLEALERTRRKLTQMIVHDLKSPITAALYNASFIHDEAALQEDLGVAIVDVVGSLKILDRMTVDMLDVASSGDVALVPRLGPLSLPELLEQISAGVRGAARGTGKSLVLDVASGLPGVVADGELLRRVVENILDNAFKYAPRDSEIRIEAAAAEGGDYVIRVRDQGAGVPAEERDRIFDAYSRLERDAGMHARSSRGVGLAFCRLAIQAHGGRIWVEANDPKGTVFVLRLPIDPGPMAGARPPAVSWQEVPAES
jgi:two-component system, sensor histidine kinase and response regulator